MKSLFRILNFGKKTNPHIYFWLLFSALTCGLAPLINIFFPKLILDELLGNQKVSYLIFLVTFLALGNLVFSILQSLCKNKLSHSFYGIYYDLNEKIAKKSVTISYSDSEKKSTLDLMERGKYGLYNIWNLDSVLSMLGSAIVSLISVSIVILMWDWRLFFVIFLPNLFTIPCFRHLQTLEVDNANRSVPEDRAFRYFTNIATDFRYAKDLRLYDGVDLMLNKAKRNMDQILEINHEYFTKNGFWNGIVTAIVELQTALIFFILGIQLLLNKITVGNFTMLYGACREFGISMNQLIDQSRQLITMSLEFDPFLEFLDLEERGNADKVCTTRTNAMDVQNALSLAKRGTIEFEVDDVTFHYPTSEELVLNHLSMKIHSGETIALVGKNGAGKTSLVKLICGLYKPTSGTIRLNGINIQDYPLQDYYALLAPTFQDYQMLPILLSENISCKSSKDITEKDHSVIWKVFQKIGMKEWATQLSHGLNTPITKLLSEEGILTSGGQEQRLAIARSVYHGGKFIIMDEPTSALDPKNEEEVFKQMLSLSHEGTSMFVSHRLSSTRYANRIVVVDQGKITEEGSHEQLMKRDGIYKVMYDAQASQYFAESI